LLDRLAANNGILIVDLANQRMARGHPLYQAAKEAG